MAWTRASGNLLVDGRAQIVDDEKKAVYCVVLHNYSGHDLWPYLVSMDSAGYSISMVYHPDPAESQPPLRKHSHMVIGSGTLDSEALSFTLADGADNGASFLKLFVSTKTVDLSHIKQGSPFENTRGMGWYPNAPKLDNWDTVLIPIILRRQ